MNTAVTLRNAQGMAALPESVSFPVYYNVSEKEMLILCTHPWLEFLRSTDTFFLDI